MNENIHLKASEQKHPTSPFNTYKYHLGLRPQKIHKISCTKINEKQSLNFNVNHMVVTVSKTKTKK